MATLPLLIGGLMLLLVTPSGAVICYDCEYTSDYGGQGFPCGQILDPTGMKTCSGSGCYGYIYNSSREDSSAILRGCGDLPINPSKEQCLQNSQVLNYTFFIFENQCCYDVSEGIGAETICYCDGDLCNYNITQLAILDLPLNDSDLVTCYSCGYSGSPINISDNSPCEKPFNGLNGGLCKGKSCATHASASEGNLRVNRYCAYDEQYTVNLKYCQENATFSATRYFLYENQCCSSSTYSRSAETTCYCVDNNCNAKFLQPTLVPRSTTTTTTSKTTTKPATTTTFARRIYTELNPKSARSSALYSRPTVSAIFISVINILAFVKGF